MDHPWHQHVNSALPLAFEGGDPAYNGLYTRAVAWKDTLVVPRNGSVTQLVRVGDWTGPTVYHCHIVEHEDIGMMGVWQLGEAE
jgi:FtsP/CotA-like multicopper oxidase with cupredoxin domain